MKKPFDIQTYMTRGVEPCPFSPYSDTNLRDRPLKDALASPLFRALQDGGVLAGDHAGGCVLYEKREQVEAILAGGSPADGQH